MYILPEDVRQKVARCSDTGIDNVEETGVSCRSIWKPTHCHGGLLYRQGEHAVVIDSIGGEVVVKLKDIFTVSVSGQYIPHFAGEKFPSCGFAGSGHMKVRQSLDQLVGKTENISRKVMVYSYRSDDDEFLVLDVMRRIFPIIPGTVVIPYYPVLDDMVLVRGNDADEVWRARVVQYSMIVKVIRGRFFVQQADGCWMPEPNTRLERISFSSILGIAHGRWVNGHNSWQEL